MCGIAGISYSAPSSDIGGILENMSSALVHRGPDDQGIIVADNGSAGLAHRRLSIIDLSDHGRQPLINEDGTLALVCNGEIYNYQELRADLERKGHRFASNSDSEVILHLFEELGAGAVEKLRGMFAFAVLDLRTGEVFCARDPFGKKPLYYARTPMGVAFASEIPALYGVPGLDMAIDREAVALFLLRNLRHIPDPWTIHKSIRSLPPGCSMRIMEGRAQDPVKYWHPNFTTRSVSEAEVLEAFDRAVARRSVADVEVGALLSGGVDSTAIVESFTRGTGMPVRTYAFGLNADDEEILRARRASDLLNTVHNEIYFDADRQHELFDGLIQSHGQPIAALPLTHAMVLFEQIHDDGLKVVMAGHGADEVFYGYDGAQNLAVLSRWQDTLPGVLVRFVSQLLSPVVGGGRIGEALSVLSHEPGARKAALYAQEARRLWPGVLQSSPEPEIASSWASSWFGDAAPKSYIDEAAYLGLMQENAHAITIAGDLPAMAHGVEVRCPFLDRDLVELGLSIAYQDKVTSSGGKTILKRALEARLPRDILYAPKRGFGYFVQEDQVLRGEWKTRLDAAFADHSDVEAFLNADALRRLKFDFDRNEGRVPTILMAKLYALKRFMALDGGG